MNLSCNFINIVYAFANVSYVINCFERTRLDDSCSETDNSSKSIKTRDTINTLSPKGSHYKILLETIVKIKQKCGAKEVQQLITTP